MGEERTKREETAIPFRKMWVARSGARNIQFTRHAFFALFRIIAVEWFAMVATSGGRARGTNYRSNYRGERDCQAFSFCPILPPSPLSSFV